MATAGPDGLGRPEPGVHAHGQLAAGAGAAHPSGHFVDEPCGAPGGVGPPAALAGAGAPRRCQHGWPAADGSPGCGYSRRQRPACGKPCTSHTVESRSMVIGPSPGPAPAAHALVKICSVSRSSWRTCPKVKARKNVPIVEGAMTRWPSTWLVAPQRSRSASSMQSPPAIIEWTRVNSLRPGRCAPGCSPRSISWSAVCSMPSRWAAWRAAAGRRWPPRGCRQSRCRAGPGCGRIPSRTCPSDRRYGGCSRRHCPRSEGLSRNRSQHFTNHALGPAQVLALRPSATPASGSWRPGGDGPRSPRPIGSEWKGQVSMIGACCAVMRAPSIGHLHPCCAANLGSLAVLATWRPCTPTSIGWPRLRPNGLLTTNLLASCAAARTTSAQPT
jgi:hypothetical protein